MIRGLSWLNCLVLGLSALLGLGGGWLWFNRPSHLSHAPHLSKENRVPKNAFELAESAYEQIDSPLLSLQQVFPNMQLPDLRQQLIYYGKNSRPDAQSAHTLLHFYLSGGKGVVSTPPHERLYLIYERKGGVGRYGFSPQNEKTSLWIVADPLENEVQISVEMENDKGVRIVEPENHASFRLPEKEFSGQTGKVWELGTFRVDGTLLARQKTRWFGCDRFLEKHGGEEYSHCIGKQRIDFGESDDLYAVFVQPGDCLIWKDNRWAAVSPGQESFGYPLLVIKKMDDRIMTLELWDVEGKGKIVLNLLKSAEPWNLQNTQNLQQIFKFVGARTKTQCLFEIDKKRMLLRPSDWLLLTPQGWKKLSTEADIDGYVKRKLSGTLFVLERIMRKDDRQVLVGTLYSPARHECQRVEFALQTKTISSPASHETKETKEEIKETKEAPAPRAVVPLKPQNTP